MRKKMPSLVFNTYESQESAGYGVAASGLQDSLYEHVDFWNPSPNILNFLQPRHYQFRDFTIGYTPWESTVFPDEWIEPMKRVDDLWATALWLKPYFEDVSGREVFVLGHGIDKEWKPLRHHREEHRPFTFIHCGEPAVRKGGDIVLEAWHKAFRKRNDCKLVYRTKLDTGNARYTNTHGTWSPSSYENVEIISGEMSKAEIWQIYALSDCMVYPSRGEGFGFIPFESMACGLPTIYPLESMGDFSEKVGNRLTNSKLVTSEDQFQHPGLWLDHDIDEIIFQMENVIDDYEYECKKALLDANFIHEEYTWEKIGQTAFDRITKMLT